MPTKTPAKKRITKKAPAKKKEALALIPKIAEETVAEETKKEVPPAVEAAETGETEEEKEEAKKPERFFEAVGRRKTASARVRLYTRSGEFLVNNKPYGTYFPTLDLQKIAEDALQKMKLFGRFKVLAKISGGGKHAQAEALRHGLARCLTKFNPDFRKRLKRAGFIKRDPRAKERKKFGLKKARRAPQWAKR